MVGPVTALIVDPANNSFSPCVAVFLEGKLIDQLDVDMKVQGFHHDMFITENYMVLVDGSTRFTPQGIVKGLPLWNFDQARTMISKFAAACTSRIGCVSGSTYL